MKVFHVFLLVLVFGVVSSHGRTYENNATRKPFRRIPPSPEGFPDEFLLVQQWPASYCRANVCSRGLIVRPYFTVHGLWAQRRGGPCNCRGKNLLNINALSPNTVSGLINYWPSLTMPDQVFWGHEYDKHASCIWPFKGYPDYFFSRTLKLAREYNVTERLEISGIKPGMKSAYQISVIKNALRFNIGRFSFKPSLRCNLASDGTIQLLEISYCFDSKLKPKICQKPDEYCPQKARSLISFPSPVA